MQTRTTQLTILDKPVRWQKEGEEVTSKCVTLPMWKTLPLKEALRLPRPSPSITQSLTLTELGEKQLRYLSQVENKDMKQIGFLLNTPYSVISPVLKRLKG
jgi:hypothetical protein